MLKKISLLICLKDLRQARDVPESLEITEAERLTSIKLMSSAPLCSNPAIERETRLLKELELSVITRSEPQDIQRSNPDSIQ